MLKIQNLVWILLLIFMTYSVSGYAQGGNHNHGGHFDPDSLTPVTVTGTAMVDTTMMYPMYYLDENGNNQADYHLNFGPYWYTPDSGNATRPNEGDVVTIYGGLHDSTMMFLPTIVVYEINGEFWRDPFNAFWHNVGGHTHGGGHHQGGCNGYAFGWMHDSLQTVSLSGTVLVDTTFMMEHYFLDEDNDGMPDYFLNFGPPWYQPTSGATRPKNGDQVSIVGGLVGDSTHAKIIVYEINGLLWRDSTNVGHHFGGGWIHKNMAQAQHIFAFTDTEDWMHVNPGWHQMGGGHHGNMMPDSLFCQLLELYPQNIPNTTNQNLFAGYEIGLFGTDGQNGMWQGGNCGGHMNFANNVQFQMHYSDIQLQGFNINENTIEVKYWENQSNNWITVNNATIDPVNNTISLSTDEISNFVILTGSEVVASVEDPETLVAKGFTLSQNYPNPFNPVTTIEFELENDANVILSVYNVLGKKINELINENLISGVHSFNFDGSRLATGIYFYELNVNGVKITKRMDILK
jgi:hypothetical protein